MRRIGLLSDTHGTLHAKVFDFFSSCDEIWHAGDIGNYETARRLSDFKPLKAVYGNIDGKDIRTEYPENQLFQCEGVKVFITHIGGYPGKYVPKAREIIVAEKPGLFISGHSHILKVMYDKKYELLHINPGAGGIYGFHRFITLVRFEIDHQSIGNLEIFEAERVYSEKNREL